MIGKQKVLAGLVGLAMAVGVPATLVLGTSAAAQACTYIVSGDSEDSTSASGGTAGCQGEAIYRLTATPATVTAGDPITLTMQRTDYPNQGDVTAGTFFAISSGTCAANVCTPDAAGTVTLSGRYVNAPNEVTVTVTVLAPDPLVVSPGYTTVVPGQPQAYTVSRTAADGTSVDVTSEARLTIDGAPCPGAVCTSRSAGDNVVAATDGPRTGIALLLVTNGSGPAASLVVTPQAHTLWNNASPVGFTAEAFDVYGNDAGDVTAQSSFSVSPDGSCTGSTCTAATAGPHAVTASYGAISQTVTLDAAGPVPTVLPTLPAGQLGSVYSASVLSSSGGTPTATLAPGSTTPPGLTLASDGTLSGAPTATGSYTFTVRVQGTGWSEDAATTIVINGPAPAQPDPGNPTSSGSGSAAAGSGSGPVSTPPVTPRVSINSASVREGNSGRTKVSLTLRLSSATTIPVTVSGHTVNGTALAGKDYVAEQGTTTIPAGRLTVTVPILIIGDKVKEKNETFTVVLTSATGATIGTARGTVTISNDD